VTNNLNAVEVVTVELANFPEEFFTLRLSIEEIPSVARNAQGLLHHR